MRKILFFALVNYWVVMPMLAQQTTPTPSQQSISKLTFIRPEGPGLWDLSTYGKVNRTEGTPYMNDDWTTGRIRFEGQPNFSDQLHVLMDLVKNELYVRLESGFIGEFPMERLDEVEVHLPGDTVTMEALNLPDLFGKGDFGYRFYKVLYRSDKFLVLHQPIKYLRKEEYIENLGMVRRADKYMDTNKYWVFDGTVLHEVKTNQRQLTSEFPQFASQIKQIIKAEQLDLNKDLGRLFELLEAKNL